MSNNLINVIYNFFTPCPPSLQTIYKPVVRLLEQGDFRIYYDDKIKNYLVKIYVGNQSVDMILDTTQIEILVPTTCCAYRGCLDVHKYSVYDNLIKVPTVIKYPKYMRKSGNNYQIIGVS